MRKILGMPLGGAYIEATLLLVVAIVGWLVASHFEAFEALVAFVEEAEHYELDEVILAIMFLGFSGFIFAARRFLELRTEIAKRRKAERDVVWTAQHDALTLLPNRQYLQSFTARLDATKTSAKEKQHTVFALDLDGFKIINDLVGHAGGDELLVVVARRLQKLCPNHMIVRIGGDEFLIIAANQDVVSAETLARTIINTVSVPMQISGVQVEVGTSIGIAHLPLHAQTLQETIRCADIALYEAKKHGKGSVETFDDAMSEILVERARLEQELRNAIRSDEIEVHYQPYVALATQEIVGFEALARWQRADGTFVPPSVFIAVAEESGQIIELSDILFRKACLDACNWPSDKILSFNISPAQLSDRLLGLRIIQVLGETGLSPHRLEIEITESCLMGDTVTAVATLEDLRRAGIKIALDDFGAGYSSLSQLVNLQFDKIKIDQTFVQGCEADSRLKKIVTAIVTLGRGLDLVTTAEGIEKLRQYDEVKLSGCDLGQGYLFGKAISASGTLALLKDGSVENLDKISA